LINDHATACPDAPFLIAPECGEQINYAKLHERCQEVGVRLSALGLAPGDKTGFMLDNGLWSTALFLGTMYSGRVIVPLNAVSGPDQLSYVIDHSEARVLFVSPRYQERFGSVLEKLDDRILIVPTEEDTGPEWPSAANAAQADDKVLPPVTADNDALLIYTSGTTGQPKGVLLTHRNVIAGGRNTAGAHGLSAADRALCVLPLYHINAEMVSVMAPLVSAGSIVMPRRFSVNEFWDLITRYHCTWFSVVPTIIAYLLEHAEREGFDLRGSEALQQLRFGRSASAPLAPEMHRAFEACFGVPIIETMGLSETAAQILANPMPPAKRRYGSPGRPYGNEAKIVDENGRELPDGEPGELMIRGTNVTRGYFKNPDATAAALEPDGWLHTGDLARRDADGFFFITGRLKELIIKGGENISPREIDEVLYQHPAVLEAAAFAVADRRYGQEVMACVAFKQGAACNPDELLAFAQGRLGAFKAPKQIFSLEELPKGPSGKIQRLKLAEMLIVDATGS
jgi:acyl-CoA synthetase (AMP-forming)/AMP-acid ligase II